MAIDTAIIPLMPTEPTLPIWEAGDISVIEADTEQLITDTSYVKVKEIQIASHGTIRVYFEMKAQSAGSEVRARIYKNGIAHGTERIITADTYQAYNEDLVFDAADLVQLYAKRVDAAGCYCKNFRLKADKPHIHRVKLD